MSVFSLQQQILKAKLGFIVFVKCMPSVLVMPELLNKDFGILRAGRALTIANDHSVSCSSCF